MFQLLHAFVQAFVQVIRPYWVPICFVAAWGIVILLAWSLLAALRDAIARGQKMHQIPCANCQFFTHDYHLKCTVHPAQALSEAAINCGDFEKCP